MIDLDRAIEPDDQRGERGRGGSDARARIDSDRKREPAKSSGRSADRQIEIDERGRRGGGAGPSERREPSPNFRLREARRSGRHVYRTSEDERRLLYEVGRFRTISVVDLKDLGYAGDGARMRQDTRSLIKQGLLQQKLVWTGRHRQSESFFALTKAGKRLAKRAPELLQGQVLYAGFCKPAELRHDAAVYRMYEREARRIAQEGGRVRRVVLDYELKQKAYSPLAKARALPVREYARRQAEIARAHGLKVVNGHITLPDLRIEYETRSGASAQLDLEVASESYHGSHAAEKAAAGFTIYAAPATAERLQAALEEREITADILYL